MKALKTLFVYRATTSALQESSSIHSDATFQFTSTFQTLSVDFTAPTCAHHFCLFSDTVAAVIAFYIRDIKDALSNSNHMIFFTKSG